MHAGNIYEKINLENFKSSQVYKEDRFHIMLLELKKAGTLKPHHSTTNAFLLMIEGHILFNLNGRQFHLQKGDMFTFKAFEEHSAEALEDSVMLLVK